MFDQVKAGGANEDGSLMYLCDCLHSTTKQRRVETAFILTEVVVLLRGK